MVLPNIILEFPLLMVISILLKYRYIAIIEM